MIKNNTPYDQEEEALDIELDNEDVKRVIEKVQLVVA